MAEFHLNTRGCPEPDEAIIDACVGMVKQIYKGAKMQELAKALESQAITHNPCPDSKDLQHPMQVAAQKWAKHCLETYQGKLLRRSLAVSAAIGDFTAELLTQNQAVYESDCNRNGVIGD